MRGEWVAIDLETTGLDTAKDKIIEVAAVLFRDGVEVDAFESLVNPRQAIPQVVADLTGISNDTIEGAPEIETVLPDVIRFVGRRPVVAHVASFDLSILRGQHNVLLDNLVIDTLDLASILMPRTARVNLRSLALEMGLELRNAHRALADARASGLLYGRLWEQLITLPRELLEELASAARKIRWPSTAVFEAAVGETANTAPFRIRLGDSRGERNDGDQTSYTQVPIGDLFVAGGAVSQAFAEFEARPQQQEMAEAVASTVDNGGVLLVEAATGVGKSLAYLFPAAMWARKSGRPVVVSTHTIGLQEQLIRSDVPRLQAVLGSDVRATVLKGRSNYLCLANFERFRDRGPRDRDELIMLGRILVWLNDGGSGDRGELPLRGPQDNALWRRLSADDGFGCNPASCGITRLGVCPLTSAYQRATTADIIIVNHALLATTALDSHIDYDTVIIDEAHNLEGAVTSGASRWLDENMALEPVKQLGGYNRGDLAAVYQRLTILGIDSDTVMRVERFIELVAGSLAGFQAALRTVFRRLVELREHLIDRAGQDQFLGVRVLPAVLREPEFATALASGRDLREFADGIGPELEKFNRRIHSIAQDKNDSQLRELVNSLQSQRIALGEAADLLGGLLSDTHDNWVYWLSGGDGQYPIAVNRAPIDIGATLEATLWRRRSVVLTSATLRTGRDSESFDHIKARLQIPPARELALGSPFDYRKSALVYIPTDAPPPSNREGHQRSIDTALIQLAVALDGRVMALFTSHAQVRQTTRNVSARLGMVGIQVFSQSEGGSRQILIEQFQRAEKAVLLGTRSLWEGVDIAGEQLSALLIAKLPFPVPNEPIVAARSEQYADPFNDYSVPEAVLLFRQGFGRLIRSAQDRGIVAVLDSRILTARYGRVFLDSLPDAQIVRGPLDQLGAEAQRWLPDVGKALK